MLIRSLVGFGLATVFGFDVALAETTDQWHRGTALSPDGKTIAFTHRGDIYQVSSAGGVAIPTTSNDSVEGNPQWSPDGQWLAYTSDRHGNLDIFLVPANGGSERRLTHHSGDDVVSGFSSDGSRVVFSSSRYDAIDSPVDPHRTRAELYEVNVSGGTPVQITTVEAKQARWNGDGSALLFADDKREVFYRKHDDSPFERNIWRTTPGADKFDQLTTSAWNDHTPQWDETGNGFYFLSERSGTINVWHQEFATGEASARQITSHEPHPVRDLSVSRGGDIAYSYHGQVYFGANGNTPAPVDLTILTADSGEHASRIAAGEKITEFVVSPDDMEIAYVVRGDVFVTSLEFGTTRQVTSTPGLELNVAFTADGRGLVYGAERMDQWKIFESRLADDDEAYFFLATRIEERLLIEGEQDEADGIPVAVAQPLPSPDGRFLAYLADWSEVRVFDTKSRRSRTLVPADMNFSFGYDEIGYSWSPDSSYLAVDIQPDGRLFFPNVAIVPVDGSSELTDLTRSGYADYAPEWHANGGLIAWTTGRFGPRQHGGHGTHTDVFAQFLNQESWDEFRRTKEDIAIEEAGEDEPEDDKKSVQPVNFESVGAADRQARLTIHSSDLAGFAVSSDASKLYYLSAIEKGYDLWSHDFREEETSKLLAIGAESASLQLLSDDSAAIVLADGILQKIDLAADEPSAEAIEITANMDIDAGAERTAMLHHIWQATRDRIYWPAVLSESHWDEMYAAYAAKLPSVSNNRDFVEILNEFIGELDISHAYARYRPEPVDATAAIGAVLDHGDVAAPGVLIAHVFHQGPLAKASDRASAGDRIVAVDDVRVAGSSNYYALVNNKDDVPVRLTLAGRRGEYDVVVRPVSLDAEREWAREQWVESRHQLVEKLSGGRLGYVYIPQMSDDAYRRVYQDLFGRHFTKEAVVIDVRDNNGGDLVDWLVQLFSGTQYMWNVPDGRVAQGEPITEWVKPSIALTNQSAYSDGHCFVASWKALGISTLVGSSVTGTCTYAGWELLSSGDIRAGTPRLGIKDPEGDWMERKTTHPDIHIDADPASVAAGRDVQLEKAVEVLLGELDAKTQ